MTTGDNLNPENRVIILKHSRTWAGDRCSGLLEAKGYQVDWCYPMEGEPLPDPEDYRAAIIFGSRDSVNDPEPWIKAELDWAERCLKINCAYLGICFGGQVLAKVLGAEVAKHEDNLTEVGFTEIAPNQQAEDCASMPSKLFQWHKEGFDLPADSTLLCSSERYPNQAFRYKNNYYGLQFHPEVTQSVIGSWLSTNDDYESEGLDPASRQRHLDYANQHHDVITDWFSGFLDRWLAR